MKVRITEQQFLKMKKSKLFVFEQKEEEDFDMYEDSDFLDVYVNVFKKWLDKKLGGGLEKYPFSHLLKRYSFQFLKEMDLLPEDTDESDYELIDIQDMVNFGRNIVEKNLYQIPSLRKEQSFLEKYGKHLERILKSLELPPYAEIIFEEPSFYKLRPKIVIDFEKMIKSNVKNKINVYGVIDDLKKYMKNYLGISFGKLIHGDLEMNDATIEHKGLPEWLKNVYNKKLKKEIKQLPGSKKITKMYFEIKGRRPLIKLAFDWDTRREEKLEAKKQVEEYLKSQGYELENLGIDWAGY